MITNIVASEDTFSYISNPTTNFGTALELNTWTYYGAPQDRTYIKFDGVSAIPPNSTINSATLYIYSWTHPTSPVSTSRFYTPSANWAGNTLTWNNQPSPVTVYGSITLAGNLPYAWRSVDITTLVRGWNNGSIVNYGLMTGIGDSGSVLLVIASRESANAPYIVVDYVTGANITATNMTINTSETPCRQGICTTTVVVRWSNSGETDGTIIPNIKIDDISQIAHVPRTVLAGSYIDETFTISGLSAGTHSICPNPN